MKTLQNNFTTPEQSKRLLELGLPADSADCYYDSWGQIQWRQLKDLDHDFFLKYNSYIPCWSVGRLIEILCICKKGEDVSFYTLTDKVDLAEWMIYKIEVAEPDFSELEE